MCKASYEKLRTALHRAGKSNKESDRLARALTGLNLCEDKPKSLPKNKNVLIGGKNAMVTTTGTGMSVEHRAEVVKG